MLARGLQNMNLAECSILHKFVLHTLRPRVRVYKLVILTRTPEEHLYLSLRSMLPVPVQSPDISVEVGLLKQGQQMADLRFYIDEFESWFELIAPT